MFRTLRISLLCFAALSSGAWAVGPDLDMSQPPDPQPEGGPVGDGEDWTGDGRADPVGDDEHDVGEITSKANSVGAPTKTPDEGPSGKVDENGRRKGQAPH